MSPATCHFQISLSQRTIEACFILQITDYPRTLNIPFICCRCVTDNTSGNPFIYSVIKSFQFTQHRIPINIPTAGSSNADFVRTAAAAH
jgi:hypothetical protein